MQSLGLTIYVTNGMVTKYSRKLICELYTTKYILSKSINTKMRFSVVIRVYKVDFNLNKHTYYLTTYNE